MGMEHYNEYTEESDVNRIYLCFEEEEYDFCGIENE